MSEAFWELYGNTKIEITSTLSLHPDEKAVICEMCKTIEKSSLSKCMTISMSGKSTPSGIDDVLYFGSWGAKV